MKPYPFALCAWLSMAAPANASSCIPGPYVVFFSAGSDRLNAEARNMLDQTIARLTGQCATSMKVEGFADRSGERLHNLALAQRRAKAVGAYLIDHGIAAGLITIEAFGEDPDHLLAPTANGVAEIRNRRVEVIPGWGHALVTPPHPAAPPPVVSAGRR